jgi:hypothetical protein
MRVFFMVSIDTGTCFWHVVSEFLVMVSDIGTATGA